MAVSGYRVAVAQAVIEIANGGGDGAYVTIANKGTNPVNFGAANVTATTGFEMAANVQASFELPGGEVIYGIAATGTNSVHVLATRLG